MDRIDRFFFSMRFKCLIGKIWFGFWVKAIRVLQQWSQSQASMQDYYRCFHALTKSCRSRSLVYRDALLSALLTTAGRIILFFHYDRDWNMLNNWTFILLKEVCRKGYMLTDSDKRFVDSFILVIIWNARYQIQLCRLLQYCHESEQANLRIFSILKVTKQKWFCQK